MAEDKDEFDAFTLIDAPTQDDRDLAAMLFAETSPPPEDTTQTVTGEAAPEETAEEAPRKPGLLARLKGLFRRKAPPAESAAEPPPMEEAAAAPSEAEAVPPTAATPRKKMLLVALAALTLLGAGIGAAVLVLQHFQSAREAELHKQEVALRQQEAALAEQKAQLEKQKAELARQQREKAAQETPADPAPPTRPAAVGPEEGAIDCAVVGREEAAQTIKRCIEAYNRATGRTK